MLTVYILPYDYPPRSVNSTGTVSIVNFGSIILPSDLIRHDRRQEAVSVSVPVSVSGNQYRGQSDQSNQTGDSMQNSDAGAGKRVREERSFDSRPVSSSEVVDELMARVVAPCLTVGRGRGQGQGHSMGHQSVYPFPSLSVLKGVLLLGPPGVGKTFAVRALQRVCRDVCTVSQQYNTGQCL
jgi:hypothetical protein